MNKKIYKFETKLRNTENINIVVMEVESFFVIRDLVIYNKITNSDPYLVFLLLYGILLF